jgi:hypothetical protein
MVRRYTRSDSQTSQVYTLNLSRLNPLREKALYGVVACRMIVKTPGDGQHQVDSGIF